MDERKGKGKDEKGIGSKENGSEVEPKRKFQFETFLFSFYYRKTVPKLETKSQKKGKQSEGNDSEIGNWIPKEIGSDLDTEIPKEIGSNLNTRIPREISSDLDTRIPKEIGSEVEYQIPSQVETNANYTAQSTRAATRQNF
ncbi:hypothetical protein RhiirA4_484521 [Rhizophagus irregularis]|uniref:Uncharacterized protein n=1 Tax=Rhizophagus irregularis TaxID=588596 RepID=A0A2I1HP00_9GLOM|nr:hypothetical protein RhiirA4_484521 [Rhizophagus irregularis]